MEPRLCCLEKLTSNRRPLRAPSCLSCCETEWATLMRGWRGADEAVVALTAAARVQGLDEGAIWRADGLVTVAHRRPFPA